MKELLIALWYFFVPSLPIPEGLPTSSPSMQSHHDEEAPVRWAVGLGMRESGKVALNGIALGFLSITFPVPFIKDTISTPWLITYGITLEVVSLIGRYICLQELYALKIRETPAQDPFEVLLDRATTRETSMPKDTLAPLLEQYKQRPIAKSWSEHHDWQQACSKIYELLQTPRGKFYFYLGYVASYIAAGVVHYKSINLKMPSLARRNAEREDSVVWGG